MAAYDDANGGGHTGEGGGEVKLMNARLVSRVVVVVESGPVSPCDSEEVEWVNVVHGDVDKCSLDVLRNQVDWVD